MKKLLIGLIVGCGLTIAYSHKDCAFYHYKKYELVEQLKDVYSTSKQYEKNAKYGATIKADDWQKLKDRAHSLRKQIKLVNSILENRCHGIGA